jgi:hypothetical protein
MLFVLACVGLSRDELPGARGIAMLFTGASKDRQDIVEQYDEPMEPVAASPFLTQICSIELPGATNRVRIYQPHHSQRNQSSSVKPIFSVT